MSVSLVSRLQSQCFSQVSNILKAGNYSASAVEAAVDKVLDFADYMYSFLARYSGYRGFEEMTDDNQHMSLHVETSGDAIGNNTLASSTVTASVRDYEKCTIAFAEASSVAAADGDNPIAVASTFTGVAGGDLAMVDVQTVTGDNFDIATEYLFAVDFKFLRDYEEIVFDEHNAVVDAVAQLGDGNAALMSWDTSALAENSFIDVYADALVIDDQLSSTYLSSDIFVS